MDFCSIVYEKEFLLAKFQKCIERVILVQRVVRLRLTVIEHKKTISLPRSQEIIKASAGLRTFIVAVFKSKIAKQEQLLRAHETAEYAKLDLIRQITDDNERADKKELNKI